MKLISHLFWLPTSIIHLYTALLMPRWWFKKVYHPASDAERQRSIEAHNAARLAAYKLKRR